MTHPAVKAIYLACKGNARMATEAARRAAIDISPQDLAAAFVVAVNEIAAAVRRGTS